MSDEVTGTYYVLSYVPDLVRGEFVNLGVVLVDPRHKRAFHKLPDDVTRLKWGEEVGEWELAWVRAALECAEDPTDFWSWTGEHIRVTPPRSWIYTNPKDALDEIYALYVNEVQTEV